MVERSRSVSSIRRMNLPPVRRAYSQQNSAVRAPPTCSSPVGLGAKRVTTVMEGLPICPQMCGARMLPRAAAIRLAPCARAAHAGARPRFAFALGPPIDFRSLKMGG